MSDREIICEIIYNVVAYCDTNIDLKQKVYHLLEAHESVDDLLSFYSSIDVLKQAIFNVTPLILCNEWNIDKVNTPKEYADIMAILEVITSYGYIRSH